MPAQERVFLSVCNEARRVIQLQKHCILEMQAAKYIQADESIGNGSKNPLMVVYLRQFWLGRILFCLSFFWFLRFWMGFFPSSPQVLAPINYPPKNVTRPTCLQASTKYFLIYPTRSKPQSIHKTAFSSVILSTVLIIIIKKIYSVDHFWFKSI